MKLPFKLDHCEIESKFLTIDLTTRKRLWVWKLTNNSVFLNVSRYILSWPFLFSKKEKTVSIKKKKIYHNVFASILIINFQLNTEKHFFFQCFRVKLLLMTEKIGQRKRLLKLVIEVWFQSVKKLDLLFNFMVNDFKN